MAKNNNHLVIMAGGVGSRFWPMSTTDRPKQFIDVLGIGRSLRQVRWTRTSRKCMGSHKSKVCRHRTRAVTQHAL